jgi:uncharacterized membrane protein
VITASITFPDTPWPALAGGLFLAGMTVSIWSYRRVANRNAAYKIGWGLKLLAIVILLLCLMEPLWLGKIAKPGENYFIILADNSASMNVQENDNAKNRGQIVRETVTAADAKWLSDLNEHFQVRQYVFDDRVQRTQDFAELDYKGRASLLQSSLQVIAQRYQDRPLAGILLLSDGNATDLQTQSAGWSALPPVYPVLVGGGDSAKDLALANVTVKETSFEAAPVTIQAQVTAAGYAGKTIKLDLLDDADQVVQSQTQRIGQDRQKHTFRFRVRPLKLGIVMYRLQVSQQDAAADPAPEATQANNSRTVVVNRNDKPYRVLYVAGRPNWEYKFLQRALSEDEQIQLVGLLRVARREPKYDWRGRRGETSNPLYRGFDRQDEEDTEQYDQPVLIRLNTRDEKELLDGFPKTAEQLFEYHALVLDDVNASFFTHDQMNLIRRFVAERGGGFLMLGGKESFRQGKFDRTPIAPVLPVYIGGRADASSSPGPIRFDLTREGWLEPWVRLYENEQEEKQRLQEMPPFRVLNHASSIKAGASVVATAGLDPTKLLPALVVQRYGNGRVASVTIGDVWRWGLKKAKYHEDMDRFWRQTLRWLVADVPQRFELEAKLKPNQINQPIEFQVRARDRNYEAMDNLSVTIEVKDSETETIRLHAQPVEDESGVYQATFIPRNQEAQIARAVIHKANGAEIGVAETGWAADLEAEEFRSIAVNKPLLETLAQKTGGRVVALGDLDRLVGDLPQETAPIMETQIQPIWDLPGIQPLVFLLLFIGLLTEWTLRRRRGLP